jgi:hypothetical protein
MGCDERETTCMSKEEYKKVLHKMIEEIDSTWLLNQILKLMNNLKK